MNQTVYCKLCLLLAAFLFIVSCSPYRQIASNANKNVLTSADLNHAHTGISIYEPATGKYWYNYQGDRYFVPASNTKIATCYAAMKYLGDSLVGMKYETSGDVLMLYPTGDPTFLHPDFTKQPVYSFLKNQHNKQLVLQTGAWQDARWGSGWSWNDYNEYYMAERSIMPVYGNIVRISHSINNLKVIPEVFTPFVAADSAVDKSLFAADVRRDIDGNRFSITQFGKNNTELEIPFYTAGDSVLATLLADTLHTHFYKSKAFYLQKERLQQIIHSQPTDSMLRPMMHRSDNFFAEQSLLMVSNQLLGVMNDNKIIDTILKTDFKNLPQKPRWVDGSGLSRYNLFTPQDFVMILDMMKNEFGMERIKNVFATGGTGTLSSYYKNEAGYIFAKTGTLSGVVAFSGYLYTKKNKLLIFSVLVNNHQGSATNIRRTVEKLLQEIRNKN